MQQTKHHTDTFMEAIEKITSKKRVKENKQTGQVTTVKVWNDTVANLTLMALGSSAPEILLNVIEICAGGFEIGPLLRMVVVSALTVSRFTGLPFNLCLFAFFEGLRFTVLERCPF